MNREEILLADHISDTLQEAEASVRKLGNWIDQNTGAHPEQEEEFVLESDVLKHNVEKTYRDCGILAERLNLPKFVDKISEKLESSRGKLSELIVSPYDDGSFGCDALYQASVLFEPLSVMVRGNAITGLEVFRTILENTSKIIHERGLEPKKELTVRNEVLAIVSYAFRDATKDVSINKPMKVYKPDIGVPSLMAAAEYKFASSEQEVKTALDGISADMKGYGNDPSWRSFFAVIYMTRPFFTQKDVELHFRVSRAELSWTPIVLVGPGN